jgi:hypothetical protein
MKINKITKILLLFLLIFGSTDVTGQDKEKIKRQYRIAYSELCGMLDGTTSPYFKRAVFVTENAFFNNELDYTPFCKMIDEYELLARKILQSKELQYKEEDKEKMSIHAAIFTLMTDTLLIQIDSMQSILHLPFVYDFNDIAGEKDWTQMFVTKLLATNKGNCHSLPYLYKILAEEMGEKAYLSLAPNHVYIKLHSKEFGWYNTELTSGMFPIDAWLMASGFIHLSSIQNAIYMDTLSTKQSIAACMVDLAQGYEKAVGLENGEFIINACNKALEYYPNYINALLVKAETGFQLLNQANGLSQTAFENRKAELEQQYMKIHDLGYRKMPEQMYLEWLVSLKLGKRQIPKPQIKIS